MPSRIAFCRKMRYSWHRLSVWQKNTKIAQGLSHCDFACLNVKMSDVWEIIPNNAAYFSFLPLWAHSYEKQECQTPPTDMVIIFQLVRLEIMTSFVCLILSNNYSLSMSATLVWESALTCMCVCECMYVGPVCALCTTCGCIPERERQKATDVPPRSFSENSSANGAQKCTCLRALQGFGISHCVPAPGCHLWSV